MRRLIGVGCRQAGRGVAREPGVAAAVGPSGDVIKRRATTGGAAAFDVLPHVPRGCGSGAVDTVNTPNRQLFLLADR